MTREGSRRESKNAIRVVDACWRLPPRKENFRQPWQVDYPITAEFSEPSDDGTIPYDPVNPEERQVLHPPAETHDTDRDRQVLHPPAETHDTDRENGAGEDVENDRLTRRVERPKILHNWVGFLISELGGSVDIGRAKEYAATVRKYFVYYSAERRPKDMLFFCTPIHLKEYFEDEGATRSPQWKLRLIGFLTKFLSYLEERALAPSGFSTEFKTKINGLCRTISKAKTRCRIKKMTEKRQTVMKVDIKDFFDCEQRREAIRVLSETPDETLHHNMASARKYLISSLLLNSGARTGVLKNLTITEVRNAEKVAMEHTDGPTKTYFVVSVSSHKTCYQGPVMVPMSNREYRALENLCNLVEQQHSEATHPFVTAEGRPFTTSRLSREWACAWGESGMLEKYGAFSPTDNRKHVISHLLRRYPELRDKISKQMKHSAQTERTFYDLSTGADISIDLLRKRMEVCATSTPIRPVRSTEAVPDTAPTTLPDEIPPCSPIQHEPEKELENTSTPIRTVRSVVTVPDPAPRTLPDANPPDSTEKVSRWIQEIPSSPIQDEPEKEPENIDVADSANTTTVSQSLFTSVSQRDYGKFGRRLRRVWSTEAEREFSHIWQLEIELSVAMEKKPTLSCIRHKLYSNSDVRAKYCDLSDHNIKDKIWNLAQRDIRKKKN
jgi:hypothetical protein